MKAVRSLLVSLVLVATAACKGAEDPGTMDAGPDGGTDGGSDASPDASADGCVPAPMELCNGLDDDCDGLVDEPPLATCALPNAADTTCTDGQCTLVACAEGFDDCNADPGCETDTRADRDACSECGMRCDASSICVASACHPYEPEWALYLTTSGANIDPLLAASGESTIAAFTQWGAFTIDPPVGPNVDVGAPTGITGVPSDAYVVEITSAGAIADVCVIDAESNVHVSDVASDAAGNTYVVGTFYGGDVSFDGTIRSATTSVDAFLLALDADLNVRWVTLLNGDGSQQIHSVHVAPTGDVLLAGSCYGALDVDGVELEADCHGMLVMRADADDGAVLAHVVNPDDGVAGWLVAGDAAGNAYTFGQLTGPLSVGADTHDGQEELVVVAWNPALAPRWSALHDDAGDQGGDGYTVVGTASTSGSLFAVGGSNGPLSLGGDPLPAGAYVASWVGLTGAHRWSSALPTTSGARDITLGPDDRVFVAGIFDDASTRDFGAGELATIGSEDAMVVSYDASGRYEWAVALGGIVGDSADQVAAHPLGDVSVLGRYRLTMSVGGVESPAAGQYGSTFLVRLGVNP